VLVGFVAITVASGFVVGRLNEPGDWYRALDKPPLQPPSAVFAPVWTVLYVLIGVAAYLAWRAPSDTHRTPAMAAWVVQLVLNLAWTSLFFGLERPGWALAEIVVLLAAIVVTMVLFHRRSRTAAWLLAPYLAWTAFATYLTAGIVVLN
jgi:benzodiazapine receptor